MAYVNDKAQISRSMTYKVHRYQAAVVSDLCCILCLFLAHEILVLKGQTRVFINAYFFTVWIQRHLSHGMRNQQKSVPRVDSDKPVHPHSLTRVFAVLSVGNFELKIHSC